MQDLLWWGNLKEGEQYLFSFLFIDRVGSTKDSQYYSNEEVLARTNLFHKIIEDKIISFNGKLLEWHGDGNTAFFYISEPESLIDKAQILSKNAIDAARAIFSELVQHEELKAYISIHIGLLPFKKEMGKINSDELNIAGHILKACPPAGILLHENIVDYLSDDTKQDFKYYGTTSRDSAPVFVYPKQREITDKNKDEFIPSNKDNHDAKNNHIKFIKEFYGKIIPRGLRQEKIVRIDLLDIYSPLKVRLQQKEILIDFKDKKDSHSPYSRIESLSHPMSVPDAIKKSRHCVILGSPGAGKSTLIKWLVLIYAEGKISATERIGIKEDLLPLPVSIGHLSKIWIDNNKQIGMIDAIIKYYEIHNINISSFIKEIIEAGKAIILFDGLDEVQSDEDRREISRWIESFITAFNKNRFVITSRIVGYAGISLVNIDTYIIENLTIEDAKPLIEKWMKAIWQIEMGKNETSVKMAFEDSKKLIEDLTMSPQLLSFIANPFLLTLTILIHKTEARLPNYRIQLFERMIQTLVETWHQARAISIIQPETQKMDFRSEAIPILAPLALWMHENFSTGVIPENDLKNFVTKKLKEKNIPDIEIEKSIKEFLSKLKKCGLLEEKAPNFWGFTHLSFEEYLCAVELVRDDIYFDYLKKYTYSARWEEIFILVASELGITQASTKRVTAYIEQILTGTGDKINEDILKKHILLAGKCVANSANVDIGLMDKVIDMLLEFSFGKGKIEGLKQRSFNIIKNMMHIETVDKKVKRAISRDNNTIDVKAIGELGIKDDWAIDAIKNGLNDIDGRVRVFAFDAMGELGIKDDWVINAIKNGLNDKDELVRGSAIVAIVRLGIKDDWAIDAIKKGLNDKNGWVRGSAFIAIDGLEIKDDKAINAIKNGLNDKNEWVRGSALVAIGKLGIKDDWVINAIKNGLNDKDKWVRGSTFVAIGKLGIKDDWVINAIKNGLNDKDKWVHGSAFVAIDRLGIKDDWAITAILNNINNSLTQDACYEALWKLYSN